MQIEEESETIKHISFDDGRKLTIIGSAHISQKSVDDVLEQIDKIQPDSISIELDQDRWDKFHESNNGDKYKDFDLVSIIRKGKFFLVMVNIILASFQKRLSKQTTGESGKEIIQAGEKALELGIPLNFVDRNVSITLKRAWNTSTFYQKAKILSTLLASAFDKSKISEEELEQLKEQSNIDTMLAEMAKEMPSIKRVLIDERDRYLAIKTYKTLSNNTLAVVGQGHVKGLLENLSQLERGGLEDNTTELEDVAKKKTKGIMSYVIPSILVLIFVGIGIKKGWELGARVFLIWAICNSSSTLLGSILTLAHPVTCLVAAITSPIAALTPVLGVGMFTALSQAKFSPSKVSDLENVSDDLSSFKMWYKNRILHTFMIFVVTSLFSGLGSFVLFPIALRHIDAILGLFV